MDQLIRVARYVGEANVPGDVKRRRRQVYDAMRRMGNPVIVKHMYNDDDAERGIAERSPNFEDPYGQVRNEDPFSYGIGLRQRGEVLDEWVSPTGQIVKAVAQPNSGLRAGAPLPRLRPRLPHLHHRARRRGGLLFKLSSGGALIQVQTATAQAPWYPEINDNDLSSTSSSTPGRVVQTMERYQAKQTNPISIRGRDRRGRREYTEDGGNRFVVNQQFEMTLVPTTNILQKVETDR
jgi:hypothetical protein